MQIKYLRIINESAGDSQITEEYVSEYFLVRELHDF